MRGRALCPVRFPEYPIIGFRIDAGRVFVHEIKCLFLVHELNLCLIFPAFAHKEIGAFACPVELSGCRIAKIIILRCT